MFLTGNIYVLESTGGSHVYALRVGQGVVLVDTSLGGKAKQIADELDANGLGDVVAILLTHHDVDHIGNAAALQAKYHCDVYISATDLPYVQGAKKRHGVKKVIGALVKTKPPEHLLPLPDDDLFGIQVIPTPGHTPGHTCYLFDGVLFAGDLLNSRGGALRKSQPLMTWNISQVDKSAALINGLHFDWVCPGHGAPVKTSRVDA